MIYITSTLKSDWNVAFNQKLCDYLESHGCSVHLPQRDTNQAGSAMDKYEQNMSAMQKADIILCVAQNESINWGVEVGYVYSIQKNVIALAQTDHDLPVMSLGMFSAVVRGNDLDDIDSYGETLLSLVR